MALKVNKPTVPDKQPLKLTGMGKLAVVLVVILLAGAVLAFFLQSRAATRQAELEAPLLLAVDRAIVICQSSMDILGVEESIRNRVGETHTQIENAGSALRKGELALEMIGILLPHAADNAAVTDELNGARNRILVSKGGL